MAANAVPLVLGCPVRRIAQFGDVALQLIGQVEGIGFRQVRLGIGRQDQAVEGHGVRAPVAHQPVRQLGLVNTRRTRERARHQLLANAHAKAAGDQLVEDEPLGRGQGIPGGQHPFLPLLFRQVSPVADGGDVVGQALVQSVARFGKDQGDSLGQIADDGIALLEQPKGQPRHLARPFPQPRRGDRALGATPGQQRDGPKPVGLGRFGKVLGQGRNLGVGLRCLIKRREQRGEVFHQQDLRPGSGAEIVPLGSPLSSTPRRWVTSRARAF